MPCDIRLDRVERAGISAAKAIVDITGSAESAQNFNEVVERIRRAEQLSASVRERAEMAFRHLFEAEAAVHGRPFEKIHLHEAGAADALIDILGTFHLIESHDVTHVTSTRLNVGGGLVECRHGTLPVPAPATASLLRGFPVYAAGPLIERITPTGAAILRTLNPAFHDFPRFTYRRLGHGAGDRDTPGFPNILRVFIGEGAPVVPLEKIAAIEATIDDMSGQVAGYFLDRAMACGALDVYFTPIFMKKNRPATKLTCLCPQAHLQDIIRLFFEESTTLGLRVTEIDRLSLDRTHQEVETPWGRVRIKIGKLNGEIVNYHPEYEDCAALARTARVPLKRVQAEAMAAFLRSDTDER